LWKNKPVQALHVKDYVRAEHSQTWDFLLAQGKVPKEERIKHPLRQWLREFIKTCGEAFTDDDARNVELGAFMATKSNLDAIKGINDGGSNIAGGTSKIRRSARHVPDSGVDALTKQFGSMLVRPSTPPRPPRTPSPQSGAESTPGMLATQDLTVISPETMTFQNDRSRDEDTVNAALVSLLDTTTLCSGIKKIGSRKGLKWHHTRHSFHLGPAGKTVCEARTDGLLVLGGGPKAPEYCLAILEVKPYKRQLYRQKVEWQEACQMAAWISTSLGEKSPQKRKEGLLHTGDPKKKRYVLNLH
jgi:hypothetical protein